MNPATPSNSSGSAAMTNMSADPAVAGARLGLLAPRVALVLGAVSVAAWAGTITWALDTGNGPGTMGLGLAAFTGMWALMMTAMMLPVTIPSVARSENSPSRDDLLGWGPLAAFTAGYVLLWAATGVIAYPAASLAGHLAGHDPSAARAAAVTLFLVAGIYQLSDLKGRCVEQCRRTVSGRMGPDRSPWRSGGRHAIWCLGCSWALMALFIAVGVMNVLAMVLITVGLLTERHLLPGRRFRVVSGLAVIALGGAVAFDPTLATGLHAMTTGMSHM
jgi:predicted metal-binding membrane protein